jgi:trimeric autotransporter adhesin
LALSDLYSLGPCLASVIPDAYFSQLGASTFVSYYSTLGVAFQPTSSQISMSTAYITSYLSNTTLMANTTRDTLAFSTLGDLAMFYPWSNSTYAKMSSNSTWTSSGASLLSTIQTARSVSLSANQLCQSGLPSAVTSNYTSLIANYASTFVSNYIFVTTNGTSTSRRKRATTTQTCTSLTSLGSPAIASLSADSLATLSSSDFYSCETLLGFAANSWSSAQLAVLYTETLQYFSTAANISDADLANLNLIVTGFSNSDLASLKFTSSASISALGALTTWSTSQLGTSVLGVSVSNFITNYLSGTISSSFLGYAGNLLCSLNQTQINGIASTAFSASVVSSISVSCPNIAYWYAYAKSTGGYSSVTNSSSQLTELGSVIAGITTSDLALISTDNIGSITTGAFQYMPAATVNSMSSSQLASLSTDQATSLVNNPNYSSFSSSVTSALSSLITGTSITSGTAGCIQLSLINLLVSSFIVLVGYSLY